MARIVIEEPCEHGNVSCFGVTEVCRDKGSTHHPCPGCYCPGGSRRVLDPGSYVLIEKVNGEWPEWTEKSLSDPPLYELSPSAQRELGFDGEAVKVQPKFILDALAGGEQLSIRERAERRGIADRISDQSGYNWPPPAVDEAGG